MGNEPSSSDEDDRRNRRNNELTAGDVVAVAATGTLIAGGIYALYTLSNPQTNPPPNPPPNPQSNPRLNPPPNPQPNPRAGPYTNTNTNRKVIVMYTDASCDNPVIQMPPVIAAIAGYVGENHPLNFAEVLENYRPNAAAETIAVKYAIIKTMDSNFINNISILHIKTDFKLLADAMNDGFNPRDNDGEYQKLKAIIDELKNHFHVGFEIEYIPRGSEEGNRIANQMANNCRKNHRKRLNK